MQKPAAALACIVSLCSAGTASGTLFSFHGTAHSHNTRAAVGWDEEALTYIFEPGLMSESGLLDTTTAASREFAENPLYPLTISPKIRTLAGKTARITAAADPYYIEQFSGEMDSSVFLSRFFKDRIITVSQRNSVLTSNYNGIVSDEILKSEDSGVVYFDESGKITGTFHAKKTYHGDGSLYQQDEDSSVYRYDAQTGLPTAASAFTKTGSGWETDKEQSVTISYSGSLPVSALYGNGKIVQYLYSEGNLTSVNGFSYRWRDGICIEKTDSINLRRTKYEYLNSITVQTDSLFSTGWKFSYAKTDTIRYDLQGRLIARNAVDGGDREFELFTYSSGNITEWQNGAEEQFGETSEYEVIGASISYQQDLPVHMRMFEYAGTAPYTKGSGSTVEQLFISWSGEGVPVNEPVHHRKSLSPTITSLGSELLLTLPNIGSAEITLVTLSGKTAAVIPAVQSESGTSALISSKRTGTARGVYVVKVRTAESVTHCRILLP